MAELKTYKIEIQYWSVVTDHDDWVTGQCVDTQLRLVSAKSKCKALRKVYKDIRKNGIYISIWDCILPLRHLLRLKILA